MQRINFTETTLTTLTRNARCSFANAVYKLTMKAQQGLKCDDLFKKSVLMNEVNKLLCKYKLDECISFHPYLEGGVSTWYFGIGNFAPAIITYYLKIDDNPENDVLIGSGTTLAEINIDINNNTESTGVSSVIGENGYITITSPIGCFIKADLYGTKDPAGSIPATQVTFLASKCPQVETCVNYTEEELNCITPQDLQLIFEFTHRYKETLAKSTKRVTSPSTSSLSSSASDCCNWGSIGGSIGNQSDLVAYLNTIKKNFISASNESILLSNDIKSLNFLGAGVTATNSGGDISITIPGSGSGGSAFWGDIAGIITEQTDLITYLEDNYYPLNTNPAGYLTENSLMVNVTNAELLAEITAATIVKGVIYRVMDVPGGIVQVVGRSSSSINKAAYREGRVDISITQVIGIYGTYDPVANTFLEQGRIATEPSIYEDAQHGYYVGQELKTLDTGLTYVCTDNTNANAVWTLVPSGGGSQDLAQVLAVDNISGPNDIQFDTLQGLLFNNSSRVREGITDAGLGGAKGVALVCSLDYELKWEAGRLYVMDQTGSFIRQSLYNFNIAPTSTDDFTLGYMTGSLWTLDDGTVYVCTDAGTIGGDAMWNLVANSPDLQQVTDAGFGTTNRLLSSDGVGNYTEIGNGYIQIATGNTGDVNIDASLVTASYVAQLPDKPTSPQTFAMLSDITAGSIPHAVAAGIDTYTATISGVTAYNDGDAYLIRFTNGNTAAATLDINGIGGLTPPRLYRNNDVRVLGGDILDGAEMLCVYNSALAGFQCIGTSPNSLFAYITNAESIAITRGQVVYAFGGIGDRMTVKLANNTADATSAKTIGVVVTSSIAANQKGIIITQGLLDGLDTLKPSVGSWADGDSIYLGATAGSITNVKPYAPNHLVYVGTVTSASNGASGRMYVKIQNGYELDELHNVQAQSPSLKDTLWYDNAVSPPQWKTASIPTILGYTPMTNPMTNIGDIVIGSTSGSPIRLGAGTNGQVLSLSSGSPVWSTSKGAFGVTFDGQGGVVSVGKTDWISIPYNCTITGWEITADQVGSCVIDVWKSTFAAFPPTAANSIAGSEKPTLASARTNSDLSLSPAWAAVTAGDCIMFYVDSCSVLTKINLIIYTNIII